MSICKNIETKNVNRYKASSMKKQKYYNNKTLRELLKLGIFVEEIHSRNVVRRMYYVARDNEVKAKKLSADEIE